MIKIVLSFLYKFKRNAMSFYNQEIKTNDLFVLKRNIRYGTMPNTPLLLKYYLDILPADNQSFASYWSHYEDQFRLLIDTIADDCIEGHWRCLCLDYIYLPLKALHELSDCPNCQKKLAALRTELRVISNYFQVSMTYNPNEH